MILINRNICLTIMLLFFCLVVKGQEDREKQPLADILVMLQERYDYHFNYAEDTVKNISFLLPQKTLSFEEVIAYLRQQTGLTFTILDNNIVSVKRKTTFFLCGYLKDSSTEEPLVDAAIQSGDNATISDENGYFELNVDSESEEINISYLGFKTLNASFTFFEKGSCSDIYLKPQNETLSEVIVSEYLVKGIDKINDGSFAIDFSDFSMLPGLIEADVLYTLQALPGIQSPNETVLPSIRGGTQDQTTIIWNGIKIYHPGHYGLISTFDPRMIQKTAFWKNGTDARYTGGISGTFYMKSSDSIDHNSKIIMGASLIDINIHSNIRIDSISSLTIGVKRLFSRFGDNLTYEKYFDRITRASTIRDADKEFHLLDAAYRLIADLNDKEKIVFSFIFREDKIRFNTDLGAPKKDTLSQQSVASGIDLEKNWDIPLKTVLHGAVTWYRITRVQNRDILQRSWVGEANLKGNALYTINDRLLWDSGYEVVYTKIDNLLNLDTTFLESKQEMQTHGLHSQLSYTSKDRQTFFKGGVRLNYINTFKKLLVEPRLSFSYRFWKAFTVQLQGEFKHQSTFQGVVNKDDFLAVAPRRWFLSDDDVFPILRSRQLSLGLIYNDERSQWHISAEGYYKQISGISVMDQGFTEGLQTSYIGNQRVIGGDFLIRRKFEDRFNAWLSFSYMNNKYRFTQQATVVTEGIFPSFFDAPFALNFGAVYTAGNFHASIGFNWHTGIRKEKGDRFIIDPLALSDDEPSETSLTNDYFRIDASAMYRFKKRGKSIADLGVSVWNLLNRDNIISNYSNIKNTGAEKVLRGGLKQVPNVVFRVYFN